MKLRLAAAWAIPLAAQLAAQTSADDVLKTGRAALGGKLATVRTLSLWGPHRRGTQETEMMLSIDLSGKFLLEQSTLSSGGQIQRMSNGGDGAVGGGMPGDDGGPALSLALREGFDGSDYWSRTGPGSGKHLFTANCVRYVLALTLAAPGEPPVAFTYGGRLESPLGPMDVLEGIGPDDFLVHLYLDAKTHLPAIMVYHESGQEIQLWLKDHKAEDGILFPHTMAWVVDGIVVEQFQVQHFKINPKFKPEKFKK